MKTIIASLVLILVPCFALFAQSQEMCPPMRINREAEEEVRRYRAAGRSALPLNKLVRVYFHICRDDDGSNPGATLEEVASEFEDLVNDYADEQLCFAYMGVDFIDNSDLNELYIDDDEEILITYNIPGCLNIFYHNEILYAGGTAYEIPNSYCSIESGNIGERSISHEVGHCFGLHHTHTTGFGQAYIDGTGCTENGDLVCDTSADPYSEDPCFSASGCLYTGTCMDPEGATNYAPPYNNIMSYWWTQGCPRNTLTPDQYARCHDYLETTDFLLALQSPSAITYGPVTQTSGIVMQSAINSITTIGEVVFSNSVKATLSSGLVTLYPGFSAYPGSGIVRVTSTSCNY